jgi:hypothetical protein
VLRFDVSTSGALITRDLPSLPAVLVNSGNPYYEMFKDAVENELAQSRRITWDGNRLPIGDSIGIDDLFTIIEGFPRPSATLIATAQEILSKKAHRYV